MGLAKLITQRVTTPEEYLQTERVSDSRHEFLDGDVYAMAGESLSQPCMH